MNDTLGWLRQHSPPFDWNLKGDPQGITTQKLFDHPEPPFDSLEALVLSLREHRQWFHLTDEEGRQLDPPELTADREIWVSERQSPWSS
jgi:hypothetical protein